MTTKKIDTITRAKVKRATRKAKTPKASYDSLENANGVKRKNIKKQKLPTDSRIKPSKRNLGAEIGRHLHENTSSWRSIMHQFKVTVVGSNGAKLRVNTKDAEGNTDAFGKASAKWFNNSWAKWCDQVDDTPLAEQVAMALEYCKREGDVLCIFDDFAENDGRLRWVEPTQILGVDEPKWNLWAVTNKWTEDDGKPYQQADGIVKNKRGIVIGYTFTSDIGINTIDPDVNNWTAIKRYDSRRNPEGSAKLIKSPWRFNQHRGEGASLAVSPQIQDIYEMLAAELQTAKKSSQIAGWLELDKDADGALQGVIKSLQASGKTAAEIDAIINGDGTNPGLVGVTYDALEGLTGGKFSYMQPGEKPVFHDPSRPNMSVSEFCDWIQVSTGASMGVGRARSTLKAETSYTAFRGEELMSWQTFGWDQKFLERRLMDFLAIKAIRWGLKNNEITEKSTEPASWENSLSWEWQKMKEVDELKTQQAIQLALKNGSFNFADTLGADWMEKIEFFAKQVEIIKELGLPLSIFETVSGTVIEDDSGEINNEE